MAGKPVVILAVYLSPCRPLIGADLDACFRGGLPVLMTGDLNAKHVERNSRLTTRRGKLVRDYADDNSCLIFWPDNPTTNPYNPYATPDVLHIEITSVHLSSCSALTSDHLPVLIDTICRSSFQDPPGRPDFRRTDWTKFHSIRNYTLVWQSTRVLRIPKPFLRPWLPPPPSVSLETTHGLRFRPVFRMKYA
jgi:hypothetical protein